MGSNIYIPSDQVGELRQGEILTNVLRLSVDAQSIVSESGYLIRPRLVSVAIVLSQDCDLAQHHNDHVRVLEALNCEGHAPDVKNEKYQTQMTKHLTSVILCEMDEAQALKAAVRQEKQWDAISKNNNERYQVFEHIPADADAVGAGLPAMVADFRRHFAVPLDEVYLHLEKSVQGIRRRCRLRSPYLEHFTIRFYNYLARVMLDPPHSIA